jgi:peptide/nickel transport system substrate-binding protein
MKKWSSVALSLLVLFSFLLTACEPQKIEIKQTVVVEKQVEVTKQVEKVVEKQVITTATPTPRTGTVKFAFIAKPKSLDPNVWTGRSDNDIMRNIFDSLVFSPAPGKYVPWLAESWTISPDGKVYTFKLRKDVKFHDGTAFNAKAVKASMDRMVKPETKSLRIGDLGPYDKFEATDDYTFVFTLKEPFASTMDNFSSLSMAPVSAAAADKLGADFAVKPVGTGPFMFEKWDGNDLYLIRNKDYNWAPQGMNHQGPAYLERLVYKEVIEPATRMAALKTNEVNFTHYPVMEDVNDYQKNGYKIFRFDTPGWVKCLPLNIKVSPTDDLRVRQALNYGIDRGLIAKAIRIGYVLPAFGPLTRASFGYDKSVESMYKYDKAKAFALLDEAGWKAKTPGAIREKDGKQLTLNMIMFDSADNKVMVEFVQALVKDLGFKADLNVLAYDAFVEAITKGQYNTAEMNWTALDTYLVIYNMLHSDNAVPKGNQFNRTRVEDKQLDTLINSAKTETDTAKRAAIFGQITKYTMDNALILPIWDNAWVSIGTTDINGIQFDLEGRPLFYNVWVGK